MTFQELQLPIDAMGEDQFQTLAVGGINGEAFAQDTLGRRGLDGLAPLSGQELSLISAVLREGYLAAWVVISQRTICS